MAAGIPSNRGRLQQLTIEGLNDYGQVRQQGTLFSSDTFRNSCRRNFRESGSSVYPTKLLTTKFSV
jgi:hypothetical protein